MATILIRCTPVGTPEGTVIVKVLPAELAAYPFNPPTDSEDWNVASLLKSIHTWQFMLEVVVVLTVAVYVAAILRLQETAVRLRYPLPSQFATSVKPRLNSLMSYPKVLQPEDAEPGAGVQYGLAEALPPVTPTE